MLWVMVQRRTGIESRERANKEGRKALKHQVQSQDLKGGVGSPELARRGRPDDPQRKIYIGKNFYGVERIGLLRSPHHHRTEEGRTSRGPWKTIMNAKQKR